MSGNTHRFVVIYGNKLLAGFEAGELLSQNANRPCVQPCAFVERFDFQGNQAIGAQRLHALTAKFIQRELSLAQMDEVADLIQKFYAARGFPHAQASIPAQMIVEGVVVMIIEEHQC